MRVPTRKPTKFSQITLDPMITQEKFDEMDRKLKRLKQVVRPKAAIEVARLAELGDFSENVEYQLAKGRLRGINTTITTLERHLAAAEIIRPKIGGVVGVGHTVTIEADGKQRTYQILGSSETDPSHGIISYTSPIGVALMGKTVGDVVVIRAAGKEITYTILSVV